MWLAVYEVFERMTYYGISSNLVLYLTRKLHQGTVTASNNVNNWVGTTYITPILGAYIADAHLGRYWTFVIASLIYLLVCFSTHLNSLVTLVRIHADMHINIIIKVKANPAMTRWITVCPNLWKLHQSFLVHVN